MVYFEEPDMHGHAFGPDSAEMLRILRNLDDISSYLDVSPSFRIAVVNNF